MSISTTYILFSFKLRTPKFPIYAKYICICFNVYVCIQIYTYTYTCIYFPFIKITRLLTNMQGLYFSLCISAQKLGSQKSFKSQSFFLFNFFILRNISTPDLYSWHVFNDYVIELPISMTVEQTCHFSPFCFQR